ncbi:hypothetical protein [Mucilaginibacter sp.]|uniref:hypothetical protein n=1 Tax=Mucilaginibacter sp. TaxID=1882438 RepID=UPI0026368607|nr:hypothetical protein [Mucilaginibacter sp.]MDB4923820.1 hypothetical protein [Mucilaginibacter sp.]
MNTQNRKSEEQLHYESLTSYLKYGIAIAGSFIVVISSVAIYFSFGDRKAMRDEYENSITNLRVQIVEIKSDAKETVKQIKEEAQAEIKATKEYSEKQISGITTETNAIALTETQKQIDGIFKTDKIQNIIDFQATKEIKGKVKAMVDSATKSITKINDAASKMRIGHIKGMLLLRSYFEKPKNTQDSLLAKNLYDDICEDYFLVDKDTLAYPGLSSFATHREYVPFKIINNMYPTDKGQDNDLRFMMDVINNKDNRYDLNWIGITIINIGRISNKNFKLFEIDEVNKWFKGLKR